MPRRCGGALKAPAESNSSVPLHMMRPRSGVTSPATMLTIEVFPAPDGPYSAVTPSGVSNFATMAKSPSFFSTSTVSMSAPVQSRAGAARQPFGSDQRDQRYRDRNEHQPPGGGISVRDLRVGVDRGRYGLRLTRDVGDERDRGAELAQRL